jgi:hypothetical protein
MINANLFKRSSRCCSSRLASSWSLGAVESGLADGAALAERSPDDFADCADAAADSTRFAEGGASLVHPIDSIPLSQSMPYCLRISAYP